MQPIASLFGTSAILQNSLYFASSLDSRRHAQLDLSQHWWSINSEIIGTGVSI